MVRSIEGVVIILLCCMGIMGCHRISEEDKQLMLESDFVLTPCEVFYKGKPLPFGQSIEEWEKIFGPTTRRKYNVDFIWDNVGIMISNEDSNSEAPYDPSFEKRQYDNLYIFYENLDGPAGRRGKLSMAEGRRSYEDLIEGFEKNNPEALTDELKKEFYELKKMGGEEGADKYPYPYQVYNKGVLLDGSLLKARMKLKEVNAHRRTADLNELTFIDTNVNGINESGSTKGDTWFYGDMYTKVSCENQEHYYKTILRYSDYELEYIRVVYENPKTKRRSIVL